VRFSAEAKQISEGLARTLAFGQSASIVVTQQLQRVITAEMMYTNDTFLTRGVFEDTTAPFIEYAPKVSDTYTQDV
jgi:hypothetical protein